MLKLIYGSSGSGKSDLLLDQIARDVKSGIRCFLLVPEQQAYISERDIPGRLPSNAGLFFEIVHFSGLAEDVFREYGGVTNASISSGTKSLLMWDTLRTLSPLLKQYRKLAKNDTSMTALMLATLAELRVNGITGEQLEQVALQLPQDSPLQGKLLDLALIDAAYRHKTEEAFGRDPEDGLLRMAQKLSEHNYFQNTRVYIDSFTSFTQREYDVIRQIMKQADLVAVSLCTDDLFSSLPHFESVKDTANRLRKIAAQIDVPVEKIKLFPKSTEKSASLCRLERDLWRFNAPLVKEPTSKKDNSVRMIKCKNIYEEAEAAALNILDLIHQGYRYGEISVVARDVETYRGILDAALERYQIPYFLSARTDFSSKPLFRLVLSALRATYKHYPLQEIINLVKTGLAGVDLEDGSLFEEYCETWHISGSRFFDSVWSMNPDGLTTEKSDRANEILDAANRARRIVIEPLRLLEAEIGASRQVRDKCAALYRYLTRLQVSELLLTRAEKELAAGRRREAGETVRIYSILCRVLTDVCRLLPDAEMSTEEFATAISLLFGATDIGSVPNLHDCVTVGSASTMRVEKIRATLVLGLCEGEFPRAVTDDGVLTEQEKEILEEFDLAFASRENVRFSEELFYVYRSIAKARERLYLFTVANELDGSAKTPSLAYNRVRLLLGLDEECFDLRGVRLAETGIEGTTEAEKACALPLPAGSRLYLSQSKIQAFALCPYRYYSTYRLNLREKKDSTPGYADDGNFLHFVFEKFLLSTLQEDGSLALPPPEELEKMVDTIIYAYLHSVSPIEPHKMSGRLLHLYTRLRKLALFMLRDMIAELTQSKFVPNGFERVIGSNQPDGLPPVSLPLKDGSCVILNGKIDRVDLYKRDDRIFVRVVDYKSGEHQFKLEDVATGMDIQLILYLYAVLSADPHRYSAGAAHFLYTENEKGKIAIKRSGLVLSDEEIREALDPTPEKSFSKKLIPQTEEELTLRFEEMKCAVSTVAERILAGEAHKTPSEDACRFCPVRDNCDKAIR